MKILLLVAFILGLSACGGGGGGSSSQSSSGSSPTETNVAGTNAATPTPSPTQTPAPTPIPTQTPSPDGAASDDEVINDIVANTSDLVTTEEFLLTHYEKLTVSLMLDSLYDIRTYVNICHFTDDGRLNYQDCLVKSPLADGFLVKELEIGNEVNTLGMAIWFYDPNVEPMVYQWERGDGMLWHLES